jgi:hypothetical protein
MEATGVVEALTGMSERELLGFGEELDRALRRVECHQILLAYQWAITHPADRSRSTGTGGRERAKRLGADGTPTVAEFSPATLAGRLRISTWAAARLMGNAIDIHHRLPGIQELVESGQALARYARHVARATRHLTSEEAAVVDEAVAGCVDGSISWARLEQVTAGAVANAAPEVARRREIQARQPTVTRLRGPKHEAHGMASLLVRGDVAEITQIHHALEARASRLDPATEHETHGQRKVRALLELATGHPSNPDLTQVMPTVHLYVHAYTDPDGRPHPIVRVEGHGPVTLDWLRAVLGPRCRFKITPVLDIPHLAAVDAYEIPLEHRTAVHLITPADVFPYANSQSRTKDIDHTVPFTPPDEGGPPGQTRIGNYGPMTRHHHRIKTHAPGWHVQQPYPGIYLWRDPAGRIYLVTNNGTQQLPTPRAA